MPAASQSFERLVAVLELTQGKLVLSLLIVVGVYLLRWLLVRTASARDLELQTRYRWRKTTGYGAVVLAILLLGVVWFDEFASVSTFLGLLAGGLAIALKDFVTALAGFLFILIRKPFDVGDRIEIGGRKGDVIDLRVFKFTLMEIGEWVAADQSTGRVIHLSNNLVLTEVIVNYTRGFRYIWNEIPVMVTFESDWRAAKRALEEIVEEHTSPYVDEARTSLRRAATRYMLYYSQLTPIVYTSIADSGVVLTIRHLCPPRQRRGVVQAISESVLDRFEGLPQVELAYPTERRYNAAVEAKPPLRPPSSE